MTDPLKTPYAKLVREAFIDPIRSVLIVDDDYPTLDKILTNPNQIGSGRNLTKYRREVLKVINQFRNKRGPYMLDIHDGNFPDDVKGASQLQETDLLVLDYDLDRNEDGEKALKIAQKTLTNSHYNLIIVHTQESLDEVFSRFALGLLHPLDDVGIELSKESVARAENFFEDNLDLVKGAFGREQYLDLRRKYLRENPASALEFPKGQDTGPWRNFIDLVERINGVEQGDWPALVNAARVDFEYNHAGYFSSKKMDVQDLSEEGVWWIRCARGFIAFKSKQDDKTKLLPALHETLLAWQPHQSRLILTKLRAAINEYGFERQDDALGKGFVGAGWYHALLSANNTHEENKDNGTNATRGEVGAMVRNHAELLMDQILPEVVKYAVRLVDADKHKTPENAVKETFGVDMTKGNEDRFNARVHHNAFIGSKPVRSDHLELGHILRIKNQYWLCMTPACDMIPNQESKAEKELRPDYLIGRKRFSALRLRPTTIGNIPPIEPKTDVPRKVLENTNKLGTIYVNLTNGNKTEPTAFQIVKEANSSPVWTTMYAHNDGFLNRNKKPTIVLQYVGTRAPDLKLYNVRAVVCGQLRYEYALHVQSVLTRATSRIGLGYLRS